MSIKFENVVLPSAEQWEAIIIGARNPVNSWDRSDSKFVEEIDFDPSDHPCGVNLGKNDLNLMRRLAAGGPVHAKYRRIITVIVTITAPLYWWKEFALEDFSCEHLSSVSKSHLNVTTELLNTYRKLYINWDMLDDDVKKAFFDGEQYRKKDAWWQMIQLLPSSYNQKRTVMLNYEVLSHIWNDRRSHKLDEWCEHETPAEHKERNKNFASGAWGFCDWIKTLPYSELITGGK